MEMRDWPFIVSVLGHLEHGIGIKYIPALRAREAEIARLSSRIEGIESDAYSGIDSLSERDVELLREAVRVCYELEQHDFSTIVGCEVVELMDLLDAVKVRLERRQVG